MTEQSAEAPRISNQTLYIIIGVLFIGIVGVGLFLIFTRLTQTQDPTADDLAALVLEAEDFDGSTALKPPREMPDFTLTNQHGEPMRLSDLRGKPTLMSFGFTHCPDICPLTLNEFRQIQADLDEAGDDVNFVFISVDGARDTPEVLASYFRVRGIDDFVGLTGEEEELRRIGVDYGLFFEYGEPDENGFYNVDHTAGALLLDADGMWVMRYAYGTEKEVIVEDLEAMLAS